MAQAELKNPQNSKLTYNQAGYWELGGKPWRLFTTHDMMLAQIAGGGTVANEIGANNDLIENAFTQGGIEAAEKAFGILLKAKGNREKYSQMNLSPQNTIK